MIHTLTAHVLGYVTERRSDGGFGTKTAKDVRDRLNLFSSWFGRRPIEKLTETAVRKWLATIDGRSQATRRAYLSSVRLFCQWLHRKGLIDADPCTDIPAIKAPGSIPRALPSDAVAATIAACRDDRERAVVMLAVGCGLRRSEIANLRWSNYDERSRRIFVKEGKNLKDRLVPVPDEVARALAPLRRHAAAPIIPRYHGDPQAPLAPFTIWDMVRRVLTEAGVKQSANDGVSTHAFRHTAASDVLDNCRDIRLVQKMLGHTKLSTTEIYLRIANLDDVAEAMEGRTYEPIDLAERRAQTTAAEPDQTDRPQNEAA